MRWMIPKFWDSFCKVPFKVGVTFFTIPTSTYLTQWTYSFPWMSFVSTLQVQPFEIVSPLGFPNTKHHKISITTALWPVNNWFLNSRPVQQKIVFFSWIHSPKVNNHHYESCYLFHLCFCHGLCWIMDGSSIHFDSQER